MDGAADQRLRPIDVSVLRANLERIRERLLAARRAAGGTGPPPVLVAVTKSVNVAAARALAELGVLDLGENRPLAAIDKGVALAGMPVRWHLVGRYQTNKIRKTLA